MSVGVFNALGAVCAALAGALIAWWLGRKSRSSAESELIARNYLVQLQDAIESLAHRIVNVQSHGGIASMASREYFVESSRYAVACVLAQHRRLTIDGIFGHLEQRQPGFGAELQRHLEHIERELGRTAGYEFPRYRRRELGDLALDWRTDHLRPVSYSDFQRRIEHARHEDCAQALELVAFALTDAKGLLLALDTAANCVARHTDIARTLDLRAAHQQASERTG